MRRILYLLSMAIVSACLALTAFAPDVFSMAVSGCMLAIVVLGLIFGIFPMLFMCKGLDQGIQNIRESLSVQSDSMWSTVLQFEPMFNQKSLDSLFDSYKDKISMQNRTGQMLGDVEDYINEDTLSIQTWNSVVLQIPGTLTGLGILGTFIGLITGISEIGFSSVDAALTSVQTVLNGIHTAFYTSIAGVILSILFNVLHRITWNVMTREIGLFTDEFHKNVIPSVEEQQRYRNQKQIQMILERLDRIPKNPGFSIGNTQTGNTGTQNESILMPQIIEGMKKGEFIFILQPKYDLNSRKVISGEAFVRWKHERLGMVSPAVFLPVLEENGYITKMDEYVWESVCKKVRSWIDSGTPIVPISVNISKTDILAGDVAGKIEEYVSRYKIPPRMLELEIARNAFTEAGEVTNHIAEGLRQKGFKIILDGFDGDFIPINAMTLNVDELKLDIRRFEMRDHAGYIRNVFAQAKQLPQDISVEGIESMEQVTALRKMGCTSGQGYYFSKPVEQDEFIKMVGT